MKRKPPYRVPLMAEIAKFPWNGRTVVSTFSGGGGSCTGYRMAGYRVVWANEFVPAAQATYRANHPDCHLDDRDIRLVTVQDVLRATGLRVGELDLLDGSPPCQAFSTAGTREKGWKINGGAPKRYDHGAEQHNELLFFEYARLLKGLQPKAFIAENVKGLTMGAAKRLMGDAQLDMLDDQDDTILHKMMAAGYVVRWQVLNAVDLGVPQIRNRVIFIGVRKDLAKKHGLVPTFPRPLGHQYTVRDACPWISRHSIKPHGTYRKEFVDSGERPSGSIVAKGPDGGSGMCIGPRPDEIVPLAASRRPKVRGSFGFKDIDPDKPSPAVTSSSHGNDMAVPMPAPDVKVVGTTSASYGQKKKKTSVDQASPTILGSQVNVELEVVHETGGNGRFPSGGVVTDKPCPTIGGASTQTHFRVIHKSNGSHFSHGDITDKPCPPIRAEQTSELWVEKIRTDPTTGASLELDPSRQRLCDGDQGFANAGGAAGPDEPAKPVTTFSNSSVLKNERRKFTIGELKRICGFPDDYVLTGSYSSQWARCGNSVPPVMMFHISKHVLETVFCRMEGKKS